MTKVNKFSDEYFLDAIRRMTVETFFGEDEEKQKRRPLVEGLEETTLWKDVDKRKDRRKQKWLRWAMDDLKLLWNISLNVDVPVFEDYERMCLFDNLWSTTVDDLEILRRNLDRGVTSPERGFRVFGGHWLARTKPCDKDDCFFDGGHRYQLHINNGAN